MSKTKNMTAFGSDVIKRMNGDFDKSRPVFGIDLGTTNSAISVIASGDRVDTIKLDNGKLTMPSCVMWQNGEFIVGRAAYEKRYAGNVVYSVKRHMQRVGKTVTFKESNTKELTMTPAQVSAEILKGLVKQTNGVYGEIKDVVVTVPAYFDQNGRNATREACELAGLNLIDILNEPTAASLCYDISLNGKESEDVLIFDFGGGTFDVTLARIVEGGKDDVDDFYGFDDESEGGGRVVSCLGVNGNSVLGGDDVDQDMYKILCGKLEEVGVDTSKISREYREELILRLESLKKMDAKGTYQTQVNTILTNGVKVDEQVMLGSDDFREALIPSYKKCKKIVDELLDSVPNSAKTMILVGGSTKNPHLMDFLKRDYPDFDINDGIGQDLAVTRGAAIKGKIDKFGDDKVQIFDVLPITIGVNDSGRINPIIEAGTTLPASNSMAFTTVTDNQREMDLEIFQGKYTNPDKCVSLGKLRFTDIPAAPAGEPDLIVSVMITATSVMKCTGSINGQKKEMVLDLTGETGVADEKQDKDAALIKRWRKAAEKMDEKAAEGLNRLIDGYPTISSKKDIMSYIRDNGHELKTEQ